MTAQRLLIADDHVLLREGMMQLLKIEFPNILIDTAHDYSQVIEKITQSAQYSLRYFSIILDLRMPKMEGWISVKNIIALSNGIPIIIYSEIDSSVTKSQLLALGIAAVECKSQPVEHLLQSVRKFWDFTTQENTTSLKALEKDASDSNATTKPTIVDSQNQTCLTPRQMDMLRALHKGLPNKLIAREYEMAIGTVKNHLFALYDRLGVRNRSEAILKTKDWLL